MNDFIIIKAGTTFPNTAKQYGDFEDWTRNGLGLEAEQVSIVNATRAQNLPSSRDCSGVVVTGSHAMVTDCEAWSERLVEWIAELLDAEVPYLGICYGHQLLAKAAGGQVDDHPRGQEIGTVNIQRISTQTPDPLFHGMPAQFPAHVTHFQSVCQVPESAIRLAENEFEKCHAMRIGTCAWGVQFHPDYNRHIMQSYIEEQAAGLAAAGRNQSEIEQSVRDTTDAARLLLRFAQLTQK